MEPLTRQQLMLFEELEQRAANPAGRGGGEVLSDQQSRFIDEYLVDLNATKAATRAGYSARTARQQGARLLSHVVIHAEMRRRLEAMKSASQLSIAGVLEQLRRLAFSDIRKLYDGDGNILPVHDWPEDIAARIAGVETEELWAGKGAHRTSIGVVKKVRFWNPNDALAKIAQYLGMLVNGGGTAAQGGGSLLDGEFHELSDAELREQAMAIEDRAKGPRAA